MSDVPSGPPQQLPVMESSIRMEAGKQKYNYINLKKTITFSIKTVYKPKKEEKGKMVKYAPFQLATPIIQFQN